MLTPKIDEQISDGKAGVDVAVLQTLQDFARWKRAGQLLRVVPEGWETIDATFKDPDAEWVGITVNLIAYTYNSERVQPTDIPQSALDFLRPQFKGKAVTPYPADDDVTLYLFHTIVQRYGWEFMDRYMANEPNFIQGHLGALRSISAGDNLVTFDMIAALTLLEKARESQRSLRSRALTPCRSGRRAPLYSRRASCERGQVIHHLVPGEGAAGEVHRMVCAGRCRATGGTEANLRIQAGQQLFRLRFRRDEAGRAAQALRGLHRTGEEHRRGALVGIWSRDPNLRSPQD